MCTLLYYGHYLISEPYLSSCFQGNALSPWPSSLNDDLIHPLCTLNVASYLTSFSAVPVDGIANMFVSYFWPSRLAWVRLSVSLFLKIGTLCAGWIQIQDPHA